ncbi:mechanosensitive ion channel domain-containing protein [Aquibium sp. ELW1220]|uniref:mechanosensitive ion channel family protein n=1 Tax=Aquibium sp. ELW1220 TaxID=2976766 RepID=UPI0025B10490|nr:mechanosensitive ion channel domain-containing protein [Aquibium sp. ELW1220]MDN2578723.1 mechanosensitive ion channel family protein [Aquibium sp. ELW1220]
MTVLKRALLAVCIIFAGSWLGAATAQQDDGTRRTFEVEALNIGLLPAPQIDRETPQAAVESFLFHSSGGDFDRAAHLLDLSRIDPARQSEIGPMLARQLDELIDRKVWIDWNELPDRPDGLDPSAGSNDPLAGEPRRSIRLALIDLDGRPVPIRLSRLKPPDGDPVWLFSAQTVDNVPALHAKYGATAFERGLPGWAKRTVLAGLALWEVVFLPLLLATAALLGFGLYRAAKGIGKRLQPGVTGELAAALAVPLSLIASGALALSATGTLFVFSVSIDTFVKPLLLFLLLGGALLILVRIIDVVIEHGLTEDVADLEKPDNESTRDFQTNLSAFRRIGLVIVLIFFIGLVFTQMNLLATTGLALVGSAGILTLVLAFAARSALSNIMASLQIALSKAATIGDSVLFEGQWSYVEKINFTFVQLKTWDNRRLIVPVTYFVSEPFENWTKRPVADQGLRAAAQPHGRRRRPAGPLPDLRRRERQGDGQGQRQGAGHRAGRQRHAGPLLCDGRRPDLGLVHALRTARGDAAGGHRPRDRRTRRPPLPPRRTRGEGRRHHRSRRGARPSARNAGRRKAQLISATRMFTHCSCRHVKLVLS